jgi:hypothetical protein
VATVPEYAMFKVALFHIIKFNKNTVIKIKIKNKKENIIQDKWQPGYKVHYFLQSGEVVPFTKTQILLQGTSTLYSLAGPSYLRQHQRSFSVIKLSKCFFLPLVISLLRRKKI